MKKRLLNIIGQVRLYSIIDLLLFSLALKADNPTIAGIILLHLGFIFYLEHVHAHSNRAKVPQFIWIILTITGIFYFNSFAVIGFLVFSFLYSHKNKNYLGPYSPFFRGIQYYFLAAGVLGFAHPLAFISIGLFSIRNFSGDLRDVTKDRKEKMKTLPIAMGFKKDIKSLHLIVLLLTTLVWWSLADISIIWLIASYIIEITTYNLTAR